MTDRPRLPDRLVTYEEPAAAAFDRAGQQSGSLIPIYELCARGMSALLPRDGLVLDLGSGPGRYLSYLAERRPDARLLGVERSDAMLELADRLIAARQLADRVSVVKGDMTRPMDVSPRAVDLVSCTFALHQLPSTEDLRRMLREATGCAVWLWDLVRHGDETVIQKWISRAPDVEPLFFDDIFASEAASWTLAELTDALHDAGLGDLQHSTSRPAVLQVHWAPPGPHDADAAALWRELPMEAAMRSRVIVLRAGFRQLPGEL
jgi:Predicted O-methyltransferase